MVKARILILIRLRSEKYRIRQVKNHPIWPDPDPHHCKFDSDLKPCNFILNENGIYLPYFYFDLIFIYISDQHQSIPLPSSPRPQSPVAGMMDPGNQICPFLPDLDFEHSPDQDSFKFRSRSRILIARSEPEHANLQWWGYAPLWTGSWPQKKPAPDPTFPWVKLKRYRNILGIFFRGVHNLLNLIT